METKNPCAFFFCQKQNQEEKYMSIYQEEMMRKLPRLGCTGTLDENTGSLTIRYNGVYLCQQLVDGTLLYEDLIDNLNKDDDKNPDPPDLSDIKEKLDDYIKDERGCLFNINTGVYKQLSLNEEKHTHNQQR